MSAAEILAVVVIGILCYAGGVGLWYVDVKSQTAEEYKKKFAPFVQECRAWAVKNGSKRERSYNETFLPKYNRDYALKERSNKIYAYILTNNPEFKGFIKIGQALNGSYERIVQQHQTTHQPFEILWEHKAIGRAGEKFTDKNIHTLLDDMGYECKRNMNNRKSEWYRISQDELKIVFKQILDMY